MQLTDDEPGFLEIGPPTARGIERLLAYSRPGSWIPERDIAWALTGNRYLGKRVPLARNLTAARLRDLRNRTTNLDRQDGLESLKKINLYLACGGSEVGIDNNCLAQAWRRFGRRGAGLPRLVDRIADLLDGTIKPPRGRPPRDYEGHDWRQRVALMYERCHWLLIRAPDHPELSGWRCIAHNLWDSRAPAEKAAAMASEWAGSHGYNIGDGQIRNIAAKLSFSYLFADGDEPPPRPILFAAGKGGQG